MVIATLTMTVAGCATQPAVQETGLQIQSYQTKEFETRKSIAFAAVLTVFQDLGYIIDEGDLDTGLITASGPTRKTSNFWTEMLTSSHTNLRRRATAFVEEMPSGLTRVRINYVDVHGFAMTGSGALANTKPVHDPEEYQMTFEHVRHAIFVRTNTT